MSDFSRSNIWVIIISLIWGIGIALLFKKSCPDTGCVMIQVPNEDAEKQPIMTENGPVLFKRYFVPCNTSN